MADEKTHWREFHPTDYIGAYAFDPGEEKVLTIKEAHHGRVEGEKGKAEDCLVVHWKEADVKPMIVNVTNSKAISKVAGSPYIEDWAGTAVSLYTTEVKSFGGEMVEGVRIRQTAPKIEKPILTPKHPKWDKAVQALSEEKTTIAAIRKSYTLSKKHENALEEAASTPDFVDEELFAEEENA